MGVSKQVPAIRHNIYLKRELGTALVSTVHKILNVLRIDIESSSA